MFEIIDHDGGNVVGSYRTQAEALETVRRDIGRLGRVAATNQLALYAENGLVAEGDGLAELAERFPLRRSA